MTSSSKPVSGPTAKTSPADGPQTLGLTQGVANVFPELPEAWKSGLSYADRFKERKEDFTEEERSTAWSEIDKAVKNYSDEMVQRWLVEMDTLLVYAGLFSAVLTAFNVESYLLLSPSAPDPVLAALTQISAQLSSFSIDTPFVNSTQPVFHQSNIAFNPPPVQAWAIWLNTLWFSSLICSLPAASVAIMVKQWIHEYNSGISGTSRHTARLRQHRYNGLVRWRVAAIIAVLPILLQVALGLFLAGLLVLLWSLNRTVAIVASSLVGTLLVFILAAIILPTFSANCAYLSPISTSLFHLSLPLREMLYLMQRLLQEKALTVLHSSRPSSVFWRASIWVGNALKPTNSSLSPTVSAMQSNHVTSNAGNLDQDLFVTAYSATRDIGILSNASTCFSYYPVHELRRFLTRIHAQNKFYGQPEDFSSHWTRFIPLDMASDMLLVGAYDTSQAAGQGVSKLEDMAVYYQFWSHTLPENHRGNCSLANLASVLYNLYHCDYRHPAWEVLRRVRLQVDAMKEHKIVLTDQLRKRVISAIYMLLRTRCAPSSVVDPGQWLSECGLCLYILVACDSRRFQTCGVTQEHSEEWKPLEVAFAMAENVAMRVLQSPEFRLQSDLSQSFWMDHFFSVYEHIPPKQLARRVSENMLQDLKDWLRSCTDYSLYGEAVNNRVLNWLAEVAQERARLQVDTVEQNAT